jgi:hypothetical protein
MQPGSRGTETVNPPSAAGIKTILMIIEHNLYRVVASQWVTLLNVETTGSCA